MTGSVSVVLNVGGLHWATSQDVVGALSRRPEVVDVAANAVSQTALVTYDPSVTSMTQLVGWVRDCGYHCSGRSVPTTSATRWPSPRRPATAAHLGMRGTRCTSPS
jgi:Cu2+-exporting ATPase